MSVALAERRALRFPIACGLVQVRRVRPLTPAMVRITFAGDVLGDFPDDEPGEIVTLILPVPGGDVVLPTDGWRFPPEAADQEWRNYTVRALRRDGGGTEVDIDFVLHGDHGPASRWAARARPGQTIGVAGPRLHWASEPDADWTLLAGDETGLPAIGAILESLPAGHPAHVLVEVGGPEDELPLEFACAATVTWVHRGDAPAGTGSRLADAVRDARMPEGTGRVWAAGESLIMRDIRRHARGALGLPADAVRVVGYWRHRSTPEDVDETE